MAGRPKEIKYIPQLANSWDEGADVWVVTGKDGTGEGIRYFMKRTEGEERPDHVDPALFIGSKEDLINKLETFIFDKRRYSVHTIY